MNTQLSAAEVILPGVPTPLYYALDPSVGSIEVGYQVTVDLSRRKAEGWVIRIDSYENVRTAIFAERTRERSEQNLSDQQLALLPRTSGDALRLKPVISGEAAFPPDLLPLFSLMAEYYGCSLADVLENAIPKIAKERKKKSAVTSSLPPPSVAPQLSPHQQKALSRIERGIDARCFDPLLLFGVTGSGKTEVYMRAIQRVLARGGSALVIVPEIALTPQLFDNFYARLQTPLGLLHSQVGTSSRWNSWSSLLRGECRVALGARSAIFAPVQDLQLIIVDEEHEHSYKQSDGLRYHARDVALMRGKLANCPVVLGSATPSYETLHNALAGKYELIEMPERVTPKPLPEIEIVDLTKIKKKEMPSPHLSPTLHSQITTNLEAKGQTVILFNRRGFSTYLQCVTCQTVIECPNCSVPLTYHRGRHTLLCHYCDRSTSPPEHCPICRDPNTTRVEADAGNTERGALVQRGGGTERVVDELMEQFPGARIDRMDRDTVTKKDSYRQILGGVRSGETDILVGTQMIAKGHDLPGVTLVGIVDADVGLHLPDFRSAEKAYQLITQASGRAGRGETAGRVIVQTRQPTHPTMVAVKSGRFKAFARYELERRQALNYPPFVRLLRLISSDPERQHAEQSAIRLRRFIEQLLESFPTEERARIEVLGPAPAPVEKIRARYRYHLLIKAQGKTAISAIARQVYCARGDLVTNEGGRIAIDVDPVEML